MYLWKPNGLATIMTTSQVKNKNRTQQDYMSTDRKKYRVQRQQESKKIINNRIAGHKNIL